MPSFDQPVQGKVWKFGDSVDTNQIAGGGLEGKDHNDTLRINCLRTLRPEFAQQVKAGDILVAGTNFGNGSARPTASEALNLLGVRAVVAESASSTFTRNAVASALPLFIAPGITEIIGDGETLEIDYPAGVVRNAATGQQVSLNRLAPSVLRVYELGGIFELIKHRLAEESTR